MKNTCKYIRIFSENFSKEKLGINYYSNNKLENGKKKFKRRKWIKDLKKNIIMIFKGNDKDKLL